MITVCVLSRNPDYTSNSLEFLRQYFPVKVLTLDFPSFSWARNQCKADTPFVMRFDTDEKLPDPKRAIVAVKRDVLKYQLVFAKIENNVGRYRWYGWKLLVHPSKYRYIGADHEVLLTNSKDDLFPHSVPRVYDDEILVQNNRTERQYMLSLARTYYFGYTYDRDWFRLREILGNITVPKFYEVVESPPAELKEWARNHTSCDPGRGFYYYFFESYPNECYLDPPLFEKLANEVYNKLYYYDSFLPYYYASHRDLDLNRVVKLNRIYMHVLGRPVDQSAIEIYYGIADRPEAVIAKILESVWMNT